MQLDNETKSEPRAQAAQGVAQDGATSVTRRTFVKGVGIVGAVGVGGWAIRGLVVGETVATYPAAHGYILVDRFKCATCGSCMLACSMAHSGYSDLSLSRIQITNNPFEKYPNDVAQYQCLQCENPACVAACPTGANHVGPDGVRLIDPEKCIGCEACVEACPQTPSRCQWNFIEKHSQKCDLCENTPFWNEKGGPNGKHACEEICPHKAITFTKLMPIQHEKSDEGYVVNLRSKDIWGVLGFPVDDKGMKVIPRKGR